jgi:hypothetical protein
MSGKLKLPSNFWHLLSRGTETKHIREVWESNIADFPGTKNISAYLPGARNETCTPVPLK